MYLKAKPMFIVARTPLHPGSGSELGVIDLPIQREKTTGYPKIESSSLKGSIREAFSSKKAGRPKILKKLFEEKLKNGEESFSIEGKNYDELIDVMFGPDPDKLNEGTTAFQSALGFTEGKLLLFPIKSVKGLFVWATSLNLLKRFKEDLKIAGADGLIDIDNVEEDSISGDRAVFNGPNGKKKLVLEEFLFEVEVKNGTKKVAEQLSKLLGIDELKERLVILQEDQFRTFTEVSTEVIARTRINPDTGTVQNGALWYEEYVPENTVFYSLVLSSPLFTNSDNNKLAKLIKKDDPEEEAKTILNLFTEGLKEMRFLQIGGNATIGKGICEITLSDEEGEENGK